MLLTELLTDPVGEELLDAFDIIRARASCSKDISFNVKKILN